MVEVRTAPIEDAFSIPRSPRRTLREISAARCNRGAQRELRRLEVERELRKKLNLSDDEGPGRQRSEDYASPVGAQAASTASTATSEAATAVTHTCSAYAPRSRHSAGSPRRDPPTTRRSTSPRSEVWTPTGTSAGTPLGDYCASSPRSRPQSASGRGPPRPPKPKPYRPLTLSEPTKGSACSDQTELASARRWKSALLPVWHDRGGVANNSVAASSSVDMTKTAPPVVFAATPACHESSLPAPYPLMNWLNLSEADAVDASVVSTSGRGSPACEHDEACCLYNEVISSPLSEQTTSRELRERAATSPAKAIASCASPHKNDTRSPSRTLACAGSEIALSISATVAVEAAVPAAPVQDNPVVAATKAACLTQQLQVNERALQLEENTRRLRENAERMRLEKTRGRVFGTAATEYVVDDERTGACSQGTASPRQLPESKISRVAAKRMEEMRKKIAQLDEVNELERQKLEQEERDMEDRRLAQEAFEQQLQEKTDREMREHHRREAREQEQRAKTEAEERREREERERRRLEQQQWEEDESTRKAEQRRKMRSDMYQMRFDQMEGELDRQWAEQEAEDKRNVEKYAAQRRKQYEDWDRRLTSERQRFASAAEFTEAARHHKARVAATADERFYAGKRCKAFPSGLGTRHSSGPTPAYQQPYPPPPPSGRSGSSNVLSAELSNLAPEERQVMKELQGVKGAPRDSQKAKVKELLLRWHPDKNPACTEKATRVFQFVQKQRELILGL